MSYCSYVKDLSSDNVHKLYHDTEYGFPLASDNELFERLILEINQAGLSWETILKKRKNFKIDDDHFEIDVVANYQEDKIQLLLNDAGIIRNKLKIHAAVYNAKAIQGLQQEYGSFKNWLDLQQFEDRNSAVKVFKKYFKFVGGEIVNEFLMSTGYLAGAHEANCAIAKELSQRS